MIPEAILSLIPMCAPDVAPNTIAQIIRVESHGNPLAMNVNGPGSHRLIATTAKEAAQMVREFIHDGQTVDVGLMQINSTNFKSLGYSDDRIDELFDPCNNIKAGAKILKNLYKNGLPKHKTSSEALKGAISAYNTGSYTKGFKNGYVAKVYSAKPINMAQQPIDTTQQSTIYMARAAPTSVDIHNLLEMQSSKRGGNNGTKTNF